MKVNWSKYFLLNFKDKILKSIPYRFFLRILLKEKKVRYSVEITTKCNINCAMCTRLEMIQKNKLKIGEIKTEILKNIYSDIKKFVKSGYKVEFVPMGLGEPLMNTNWIKILTDVKKISPQIYIVLVTNGVMLDNKSSQELIKIGVDEISISLNVNNPQDYKKYMRGGDNYQNIKNNIKNLIDIRNKKFSKTKIFIQYLDYKSEANKFFKDIAEWKKIMQPGDKCYIHPIVNQAGFKKEGITLKSDSSFPCFSPLTRVAIRINGDMYPCDPCFYGGNTIIKELYLGNIKSDSFYKLLKNSESKIYKIIEKMKKDEYSTLVTCKKCNTYKLSGNPFFSLPFGLKINHQKWF